MSFELHHGDCLEVMKTLPDNSIDCVITDPPYNAINRKTNGLRVIDKGVADSSPVDVRGLVGELVRLCSGSFYVFCSDEQYTEMILAFKLAGCATRKSAWHKTNPSPMNGQRMWLSALELCVYAKKAGATFNVHCQHPVWRQPVVSKQVHPTQKPTALMREQLLASTNPGDTILDPFMGSGSTGVAALLENRNFIGIEKDETYFNIAKNRIETTSPLFT
jgi:site-specific DNA-methyltransferase (adenine-specific)